MKLHLPRLCSLVLALSTIFGASQISAQVPDDETDKLYYELDRTYQRHLSEYNSWHESGPQVMPSSKVKDRAKVDAAWVQCRVDGIVGLGAAHATWKLAFRVLEEVGRSERTAEREQIGLSQMRTAVEIAGNRVESVKGCMLELYGVSVRGLD